MIYPMRCNRCGAEMDYNCPIKDHGALVKPGISCFCGGKYKQVITGGRTILVRSPFPKGDPRWEHATPDPVYVKDKEHLKDLCEEHGNISRYLEDDM